MIKFQCSSLSGATAKATLQDGVYDPYSSSSDANGLLDPFGDLPEAPAPAQSRALGCEDIPLVAITEVVLTDNQSWTTMEEKKAVWI